MENGLLQIDNLVKHFPSGTGAVRAVDGVSFTINSGETLGLVGESGCGKSTTGRMTLRLIEPTSGAIQFDGQDMMKLSGRQMKKMRQDMQIIFQDPFSSLDPRRTLGETIGKPMTIHGQYSKKEIHEKVLELMGMVGLDTRWFNRYPHELDGGRRQRVGIARALAVNPKYIVCDEPVSALDVSVQAQVLNLLQDIQEKLGITYLFISHDLGVVKHVSKRIAVMYLGQIVELADSNELFKHTQHPYTKALFSAIPVPSLHQRRERMIIQGDVPSPKSPPSGCRFHTRCPVAIERCKSEVPVLKTLSVGHQVACHLAT